jgi:peptidyl-prolyl cis-trans isomerase C
MTSTSLHVGSDCTFPAPRRRWIGIAAALALLAGGCSPAPDQSSRGSETNTQTSDSKSNAVVAKVNGAEIRESDLAIAEEDVGQNMPPMPPAAKRDYLITYVADMILIAKQAEAKKLGDSDDFKRQISFIRNKLLMEMLMQSEGKAAVSEEALRKVYDEASKQMAAEQEVRARHILFVVPQDAPDKDAKDAEAKAKLDGVIARLKKGEDFVALANELTEDPSGKENGGDLSYFTKDQMVPEFADVAFKMEPGQVSGPVKTPFGWHVIKLEDKRQKQPPEFDKVRSQVETFVVRKAQADYVAKLRADAKIEKFDVKPEAKPSDAAKPEATPAEPEKK